MTQCTFFNSGNYFHFKPHGMIYPPNNEKPMKALDFYHDLAKMMNRKDCFVVESMPISWHYNKLEKNKKKKTVKNR